ncbi:MAG: DNA polymerase III subunit gamma/tau [Lentisphaeria bacterium]|jgi:DNA polymerase-3 subunit gamma/tau
MSSYQVIARKWRPQTFADVVGQEHITRILRNAILQDRVGHAYLFIGPRGTGKTTTARIFAKALNCRNRQPDGEPCCECSSCREIAGGQSLDVLEIDGASHNKVEHARDLIGTVQYTPAGGRYKIYIIDEVHMLTDQAWNALLKTLEEPPAHVKFLFATTEPHKILATILSRCQRLDLKRIPPGLIAERLRWIAGREQVAIADDALQAIARAADGGMRDAQSIFDQMIAFCGGRDAGTPIGEADIMDVFGLASGSELLDIAHALFSNDLPRLLLQLQNLADRGRDLEQVQRDLVLLLRDLMVVQLHPEPARVLEGGLSALDKLRALAAAASHELVQRLLEGLMAQEGFLRYALNKRVALEVVLIRVLRDAHGAQIDDVIAGLANWKRQGASVPVAVAAEPVPPPPAVAAAVPVPAPPRPVSPPSSPAAQVPGPEPVSAVTAAPAAPEGDEAAPPADIYQDVDEGDGAEAVDAGRGGPAVPAQPAAARQPQPRADAEVWQRVTADPFVQKFCSQVGGRVIDVRG